MKHAYKITIALTLIGLFIFVGYKMPEAPKTAFVHNSALYQEFEMRLELENKYNKSAEQHKAQLDSMLLNLEFTAKQLQLTENPQEQSIRRFKQMESVYMQLEQQHEEADQKLSQQYYDQIWTQLNQYIQEYGAEHNYQYIYGANGDGTIMYAAENSDITKELTAYINQQYQGH
jgi:outer membrane protein